MSAYNPNGYAVQDQNGKEWARYSYPSMAQSVADRCNAGTFLRAETITHYALPFVVAEVSA